MKLFRKLLLSLLPEGFQGGTKGGVSPIGMFVGLVAPKQFFSLIHRKIIENYKINQFDINLDSFEASIGFGQMRKMSKKEIDNYYAYQATANINGWIFYCPSTIANIATIVVARSLYPILQEYDKKYALALFEAIVVLCYAFASKLKKIDTTNRDEALRWTVELVFSAMDAMDEDTDDEILQEIQGKLLYHMHVFIFLMYTFEHLYAILLPKKINEADSIKYILGESNTKSLTPKALHELNTNIDNRVTSPVLDEVDDEILGNILPSDSLIISLLSDDDWALIAQYLFESFMDVGDFEELLMGIAEDATLREKLITSMADYTQLKQKSFEAIKTIARKKFGPTKSYQNTQEIDTFMSTIEEKGSLEGMKIPDSIREESMLMDKLMNFYIGYTGGLFVARGDSYQMRMFHAGWLNTIYDIIAQDTPSHDVLYYYGGLLYHYSKNLYYYQYAFDNIKSGNEMFSLPLHGKAKQSVYTNTSLIDFISISSIATLFQDFNDKIVIITLSDKKVLESFKNTIGPGLQSLLSRPREIISSVYRPVFELCNQGDVLSKYTLSYRKDIKQLKENLYTLDFWLWWDVCDYLAQHDLLGDTYNDSAMIGILAMLRDTWTGWLIWINAVQKNQESKDLKIDVLWHIYVVDILNLSSQYVGLIQDIGNQLQENYSGLISIYGKLDDTPGHLNWGIASRKRFLKENDGKTLESVVAGDDCIWFRTYLKGIQYYTRRYLKPNT